MAARAKTKFLAQRFAHAISVRVHHRDLEHAYVTEFDCLALLAMLQTHLLTQNSQQEEKGPTLML